MGLRLGPPSRGRIAISAQSVPHVPPAPTGVIRCSRKKIHYVVWGEGGKAHSSQRRQPPPESPTASTAAPATALRFPQQGAPQSPLAGAAARGAAPPRTTRPPPSCCCALAAGRRAFTQALLLDRHTGRALQVGQSKRWGGKGGRGLAPSHSLTCTLGVWGGGPGGVGVHHPPGGSRGRAAIKWGGLGGGEGGQRPPGNWGIGLEGRARHERRRGRVALEHTHRRNKVHLGGAWGQGYGLRERRLEKGHECQFIEGG